MKALKWLLGIVAALVVIVVGGGLLISPKFHIERSLQMQAAPDKAYALVAAPRRWKDWTVWNQRDPAMQVSYFGAESGAGAGWSWQSATEGSGKMTLTAADPPRRIAYDLYFPDFGTTSTGELRFEAQGGGTRVTWTMDGDMGANPVWRWMALFMGDLAGKDFDAGLSRLKTLAEAP
jgi:uncharacterized protein YndB with AHSA1/START domain